MTEVHRGLAGVVVDTTEISTLVQETNTLTYRGYPVQELAEYCRFEETAYLIWHGELPDSAQLDEFMSRERSGREVPDLLVSTIDRLPETCHPMDTLRTALSILGADDPNEEDPSPTANLAKSVSMFSKIPTIIAQDLRRRRGLGRIPPESGLGFSENFFHMCFGEVPESEVIACFETSMTLYAEHSFNASTFAARVVTSTTSDIYSAVVAGIGALKGPLHGGANEAVMEMMLEIDDPDRAADWLRRRLAEKEKIMGFGHRVYRNGDSRVPTMKKTLLEMAEIRDGQKWVDMYERLEEVMVAEKGIYPNLDFPTGPAYYLMGFDIPVFTPLFVMSRITGWTAHVMEQTANNALIRPLSSYTGQPQRSVPDR